uniref:Secreted protein n=1 Tax=Glossina palpalis gambiensis TaxID=67801 RepID=A0A1B0BJT5_9MUSC
MVIAFIIAVMTIMEVKGNVDRSTVAKVVTKKQYAAAVKHVMFLKIIHILLSTPSNQPTNQQKQNEIKQKKKKKKKKITKNIQTRIGYHVWLQCR